MTSELTPFLIALTSSDRATQMRLDAVLLQDDPARIAICYMVTDEILYSADIVRLDAAIGEFFTRRLPDLLDQLRPGVVAIHRGALAGRPVFEKQLHWLDAMVKTISVATRVVIDRPPVGLEHLSIETSLTSEEFAIVGRVI